MNKQNRSNDLTNARPNLTLRTGLRAGVKAGDRDGHGIPDTCTPPFSRNLPPLPYPGLPRTTPA